jgi:hypothetical protein
VLSGKFDSDLAYRAARRYLGSWLKADKLVPPTFRQPDEPQTTLQLVNSPVADAFAVRVITRGTSRSSADSAAFSIVARVVENRLKALVPAHANDITVVSYSNVLPGTFVISFSGAKDVATPKIEAMDLVNKALGAAITDAEFQAAKQAYLTDQEKESVADRWLDVDTYKTSPPNKADTTASVSISDAQRVLNKIQKQTFATVVLSSAKQAS